MPIIVRVTNFLSTVGSWLQKPSTSLAKKISVTITVLLALLGVGLSYHEVTQTRMIQEIILLDQLNSTLKNVGSYVTEVAKCKERRPYGEYGYINLLERLVKLDISLQGIEAICVNFLAKGSAHVSQKFVPPHSIDLSGAHLVRSRFVRSYLRNAKFSDADLRGAAFLASHLSGANFSHADLRGTSFWKSQLDGVDFSHADLGGAYFGEVTDITNAIFTGANLHRTNLSCVELKDAHGLTQQQLDEACAKEDCPPTIQGGSSDLIWKPQGCVS